MTQIEKPQQDDTRSQGMHIQSFLKTSRAYFSLPYLAIGTKAARPLLGSRAAMSGTPGNSCRKLVQSFLLVAGVGFFAAGPVMADTGCDHARENAECPACTQEAIGGR